MTATELARALAAGRRAQGLSQKQVGFALDVSASEVGRWERGVVVPRAARVSALARILDLPEASLQTLREQAIEQTDRRRSSPSK